MESASIPARPPRARADIVREFISRFGLIAILLVLPVVYGIQDLQDEGDLGRLATNVKDGLSNGAIWALIAVGYTLVYGIIELINFAHGDLFMLGSRSEEHTSELQSRLHLVCRRLLGKKKRPPRAT